MWHLIRSQLAYNWFVLVATYVGCALILLSGTVKIEDPQRLASLVGGLIPLAGLMLGAYLWFRDVRERRALSWLTLPVRPSAWLGVRLLLPVMWTAGFFVLALGAWAVRAATAGDLELVPWLWSIGPFLGVVLALLVYFPFAEELNFYFRRSRVALVLLNAASVLLLFYVALSGFGEDWPAGSVLVALGATAFFALGTAWAYRRRDNFLIVSHPVHGMPLDLSREEGRFSLR